MSQVPRVEIERALYRPEVFQYRSSRAFGEPVEERPLPALLCVVPAVLLVLVYLLFASASYRPRAKGTASVTHRGRAVRLSISGQDGAIDHVEAGDEVAFRLGAGPRFYRMVVRRASARPCGESGRCVELEGPVQDPDGPGALEAESLATEVLLPSRSVAE